jgi:hypothetical protein
VLNVIKLFMAVITNFHNKLEFLSLTKPFQPSPRFVGKVAAYSRVEQLKCTSLG